MELYFISIKHLCLLCTLQSVKQPWCSLIMVGELVIVPSLYVCLLSKIVEDERLLVMGTKLDGLERFARDGES